MPLRIAGLFTGIGGFEVAFHRRGHKTSIMCEIDDPARDVLFERFPGVTVIRDVRDIDSLRNVDLVCAGFPCQDLSSSGQKEGIGGSRSGLISEVFRILTATPTEWVLIENVPFMLHLNGGAAMREIVSQLDALGYRWAYRVLDSQDFGVPQRRRRVFLLGSRSHDPRVALFGHSPGVRPEPPHGTEWAANPVGFYWTEGAYSTGLALNAVPPLKGGSTIGIPSPPAVLFPDGHCLTPDIRDAERLQGFPSGWTEPAAIGRRSSVRWKLVGNSVTTVVAEWLASRLEAVGTYDDRNDRRLLLGEKWPEAAWGETGQGFVATPAVKEMSEPVGIGGFLNHDGNPLSIRAVSGFLKRARSGNLRYPPGFLDSLDRYALSRG